MRGAVPVYQRQKALFFVVLLTGDSGQTAGSTKRFFRNNQSPCAVEPVPVFGAAGAWTKTTKNLSPLRACTPGPRQSSLKWNVWSSRESSWRGAAGIDAPIYAR